MNASDFLPAQFNAAAWFVDKNVAEGRGAKPAFLYDPLREIETYRRILGPRKVDAPACYGAVADPRASVAELPLLAAAERHQLLAEWNDTADAAVDSTLALHRLLAAQVARTPDALALTSEGEALTRSSACARMIMPGMQYPHWAACSAMNACCRGPG